MARTTARVLDEYLVVSAQAGDRKALDLLVRRWHGKLVAHAWRLTGDSELARDAAQAGWIEIMRGLERLQDARAFPAWAFRIVSRRCARQIGGAIQRRKLAEAVGKETPTEADDVDGDGDGDGDARRLRRAIRALPPEQRSAIALFYFEELSVAETAVALNVPAGTVKTRLMHARRKLRDLLEGETP
ncbi:MAG: RNA polymerase sigma factor [Hyphomonadaceae bacterium]|nr:RNA polymerase sigma factor [Hyphomonadaceae bacterium]